MKNVINIIPKINAKGVELLWNISTVHRKFDKDIKIGGVWKKIKERILNCLP